MLGLVSTSKVTVSVIVPSLALVDCMYSMSSAPLICCSSGVATDCSIVTASAPVYVVLTMICGGTMSGNWATGSPDIATNPPMTVTIAIATTGRLMNSLEIILSSALLCGPLRTSVISALKSHFNAEIAEVHSEPQ